MDLAAEISKVKERQSEDVQSVERRWATSARFVAIQQSFLEAKDRYELIAKRHQNRPAVMFAYDWRFFYILGLLCLGATEWLINFDILYRFFQIPALAAGSTLVLALAVAFAADSQGTLIKQGSYRFHDRQYGKRLGDWSLLALSILALFAALSFAAGTRYATAMHDIGEACKPDAFGRPLPCDVHVTRDVIVSLIANVLAWLVGIFFVYISHDIDPDYMTATREFRKTAKRFQRARRGAEREIKAIHLNVEKEVKHLQNLADSVKGN